MRKKIVAGNWKMNMTVKEADTFLDTILPELKKNENVDVMFLVPAIDLMLVADKIKKANLSNVYVGTENLYFEDKGAYTGETSADMIIQAGGTHVIIGHSERRQIFGEDDEMINKKIKQAINKNIIPILCVGETLEERENRLAIAKIKSQLNSAFEGINEKDAKKIIIAYEPIWAIGTGKTATSDEAENVCRTIRDSIENMYGYEISDNIRILYGGSVNSKNAKELFDKPNIDGGLVGGASLKQEFLDIIYYN